MTPRTRVSPCKLLQLAPRPYYVYRKVNGRPERVRLGTFPTMTVEQARKMTDKVNGAIAEGRSPAQERREHKESKDREITLFEVLNNYCLPE